VTQQKEYSLQPSEKLKLMEAFDSLEDPRGAWPVATIRCRNCC